MKINEKKSSNGAPLSRGEIVERPIEAVGRPIPTWQWKFHH